jgi:hypothetical protein
MHQIEVLNSYPAAEQYKSMQIAICITYMNIYIYTPYTKDISSLEEDDREGRIHKSTYMHMLHGR